MPNSAFGRPVVLLTLNIVRSRLTSETPPEKNFCADADGVCRGGELSGCIGVPAGGYHGYRQNVTRARRASADAARLKSVLWKVADFAAGISAAGDNCHRLAHPASPEQGRTRRDNCVSARSRIPNPQSLRLLARRALSPDTSVRGFLTHPGDVNRRACVFHVASESNCALSTKMRLLKATAAGKKSCRR